MRFKAVILALVCSMAICDPVRASQTNTSATAAKPDIILIVADDLGYGDLGVQGCKDVPTPNIDAIAANGVRFTSGYVTCPTCSPSRAGLLTGRYQQRFGHEFNPTRTKVQPQFGLPVIERTIADRLKAAGYGTGAFGKWHLGYRPEMHPLRRGFDEFFGFPGGMHDYMNAEEDAANPITSGTEPLHEVGYTTDAFTSAAVEFLRRRMDRPAFVYLAYNAVHTPLIAPDTVMGRFSGIADPQRRVYAATLSAMDDNVGKLMSAVRSRETACGRGALVFFISDNGGPTSSTTSRNDPLKGQKGQLWEGGIRVPFMVSWTGKLPEGIVYDQPVSTLDVAATCLAAAGVGQTGRLDGVDLVPYLTGAKTAEPHPALYWRYGEQLAVRAGDWKWLTFRGEKYLYNLHADVGEIRNLIQAEPARAKAMETEFLQWNTTLAQPLWEPEPRVNSGQPAP